MDISLKNSAGGTTPQSYPAFPSTAKTAGDRGEIKMVEATETSAAALDKEAAKQELMKSVDALNKLMQPNNTHLSFVLHEKLHEYYVQIVDNKTEEVVKEIPSKKILDMVAEMKSKIGLLIDEKR
ncbi:flagellar protein FlaG [Paenibacillus konkukensis]|uniref:Flagellar protein FlaG n=2 Tax=Paenibacillus TaxID=44249 RepID=A0ABY4RQA7_9BACL|nr:flagellar protein FlaG [Paenibacillus konkukensis]